MNDENIVKKFENEIIDVELNELYIIYDEFLNENELYINEIDEIKKIVENKIDELIENNINNECNEFIKDVILCCKLIYM